MQTRFFTASILVLTALVFFLSPVKTAYAIAAPEEIVEDGNWAFVVTEGGMHSWLYATDPLNPSTATTHLSEHTYWYRIGNDTREHSAEELYSGWDSFFKNAANDLTVKFGKSSNVDPSSPYYDDTNTYDDPMGVTFRYFLIGGTDPGHSTVQQTVEITNLSANAVDLAWYEYTDFNLDNSVPDVSADRLDPRRIRQEGDTTVGEVQVLGTPDKTPMNWEIDVTPATKNKLSDNNLDNLSNQNGATLKNVDSAHAFQQSRALSAGEAVTYEKELSLSLTFDPRVLGSDISVPLLPINTTVSLNNGDPWQFEIGADKVRPGRFTWIDPEIAIGYDYEIGSGPNFESLLLPPGIGDDLYFLHLYDMVAGDYLSTPEAVIGAGSVFNFLTIDPLGVNKFRILGIEESAALDPTDPTAFVTGLTFTGPGPVSMTMTPVTLDLTPPPSATAVPEPATMMLMGIGLAGMGFVRRRK